MHDQITLLEELLPAARRGARVWAGQLVRAGYVVAQLGRGRSVIIGELLGRYYST
jgi:hypothetical protein